MAVKEEITIERAKTAESIGVSSKEVQAFIDHSLELGKELHTLMVIRHGKVALEAYREPYGPDHKHMMYSVSKSITSTAIGFAIEEGLMTLDTKFVDVFPEVRGSKEDPNLEKLTVRHLLSMRSGLSISPLMDKTKEDWLGQIFDGSWGFEPDTEFLYTNENMYLLCCLIHRLAKTSVVDYLTPRLFEPLGIENVFWESDPKGIEAGGWGAMLSTNDLAKFILCYQQGGKFGGKQIIPEWWTKEATKFQSDNSVNTDLDSKAGYGYCFWRNGGCDNSYRADGMFCQFGFVFEDYDACVILTGGEIFEQRMRDVIWEHFPKAFDDNADENQSVKVSFPPYEKLPARPHSFTEKMIENKTIKFTKPVVLNTVGFPVSVLPLATVFMSSDKAGNISNVSFNFSKDELIFTWTEGDEVNSIRAGMDGEYRRDTMTLAQMPFHTYATACWNSENELELHIRPIEAVAERILIFKFNGNNVTMMPSSVPSSAIMADWLTDYLNKQVKQAKVKELLAGVVPVLADVLDAKHIGRIK